MKIRTNAEQGSSLLIALASAAVMGITLMSYLDMTNTQNKAIVRSQAWNSAIPYAEAGIEEALGQLHYSATNLAANGWTSNAGNVFTMSRTIGDGRYVATISNTVTPPVVYATGYAKAPISTNEVSRTVMVTTVTGTPSSVGMISKGPMVLNTGTIDSFDSSNPLYNTLGQYDPLKRLASATVLTDAKTAGAISVGNVNIYGSVFTGAGGSAVTQGGRVGDAAFVAASPGTGAFETGHSTANANVSIPDVTLPFTTGFVPASGTTGGTNYTYMLTSGDYEIASDVNIGGGKSMVITGNARLYVTGKFEVGGSGYIYVAPGASLKLYVAGSDCTISGTGAVNGTGLAKNLSINCLPTCSTCTCSGSAAFIGTVYAPESAFTFSGSAGAIGSFTANTVTVSGAAAIHLDSGLAASSGQYVVGSWNEI